MTNNSPFYNEILKKLEALVKKEYILGATLGVQSAMIISLSLFVSFAFIEMLFYTSSTVRSVMFFIFLVISFGLFGYLFILPLLRSFNIFRKTNYYNIAGSVGNAFPSVKDDLLNAMQLITIKNNNYSSRLIDAAFSNAYKRTETIRFESIVSFDKAKRLSLFTAGVVLVSFIILFFNPALNAASIRLLNFDQEYLPPQKYHLFVSPGNHELTKGDDIAITVEVKGEYNGSVSLAVKDDDKPEYEFYELKQDSLSLYTFQRKAIRNSFSYYAAAGEIESEKFHINIVDPPVIKALNVVMTPPAYSKLPEIVQSDNGNVTGLIGSSVRIKVSSTKELHKSELFFTDSSTIQLNVSGNDATGSFRISKEADYKILLTDLYGNQNQFPITYSVKTLYDAYPAIDLVHPGKDLELGNDNRVGILVKVADDYGFTKLMLMYKIISNKRDTSSAQFKGIEIPFNKNDKEAEVNYIWNLTSFSPSAADHFTYYLEIFDNDNISGPKSAKTPQFNIRVPSLDELIAKADKTQNEAQKDLNETLKQADELKKELEQIAQDLKKDQKEISWQEKEKIEKAMEKFQELQQNVEKVNEQLKDMQQELQENNLLSEKTLEKYMELQKLMDEMSSDDLKNAFKKMEEALKNLIRKEIQEAVQNMKMDEEAFQKSIERTMNLLKRVQIEQKVEELKKQSEKMVEAQEKLQKETSEKNLSNQEEREELAEKQDQMTKDLEKLQKNMEQLAEKMKELKDMPSEKMENIAEEFEKQQNQQLSEDAEKQLKMNQKQQAQKNQQQLKENMKKTNQMMSQMQQEMQQMNQMETFADMMRMMDNLLTLSRQQEELRKESEDLFNNSSSMLQNSNKQNNLQRNLDNVMKQMGELAQKTFAITPEMGKALGEAKMEMNKSMQALQSRNGSYAASSQGEAMKSLNEAASLMKSQMDAMMQGGGQGGGMMSLMQQLGQMQQQQMGLNNMTQQLQQQGQGQMSPEQQGQLQRLAQQQELIRKSAEQLNKEARQSGKSKTLPANLDNINKQMQEVINDMRSEKLNDNLIQKQERILSRLLDAQRSINERDFEKQRESNTGENVIRESPGQIDLASQRGKDKIQEELNKAIKEGYNKDYENLIRRYYEMLRKENLNN
jgi:hypothetical protein